MTRASRRGCLLATLLAAVVGLGGRVRADGESAAPTEVEKRVRTELDAAYSAFAAEKKPWLPPFEASVAALGSHDAAQRRVAGTYLAALARMTDADARSGRTPNRKGWSIGGPQDVGDEIRWNMASALDRAKLAGDGGEALDVALSRLDRDMLDAFTGRDCDHALDRLLDGIAGRGVVPLRAFDGEPGMPDHRPAFLDGVGDSDQLARNVLSWTDSYEFAKREGESDADAATRHRADAAARLRAEFVRATEGTPTTLELLPREAPLGSWKWVSCGWVLRTRRPKAG